MASTNSTASDAGTRGASAKTALRALIVEDSEFDALMMVNILRKGGYEVTYERVETGGAMKEALAGKTWDIILADYNLPEFNALAALTIAQESQLDLPFIIVSGGIGEDIAVAAMKAGAHDYLMKGNLNRLAPAVERELRESAMRARERVAQLSMQESERRYRLLWETCPDAVILMDTDGQIVFANPAVKEVFGYAPEELMGRNLKALQPESLQGAHLGGMRRYLATGLKRLNWRATETVGLRKDGAEIPVEVSYSDMALDGQRRFVGFIRDITERKRQERQLRETYEKFRAAREIQQRLFPTSPPQIPGFDIAGASYPAEETGGDYYDYLSMRHGRHGLTVGDVTGHGVGAALLMAETRAYLRLLATRREDVGEILTFANVVLAEDVQCKNYVTLFLARLDAQTRTFTYASAGHPPAHVLDRDGNVKHTLGRGGFPLGMKPDSEYASSSEYLLAPGDILLVATDGIEEACAHPEDIFGLERTLQVVRDHRDQPAAEIVNALYRAARDFSQNGPQEDDLTAVVMKVLD